MSATTLSAQEREAWLASRKLGSSDCPTILGLNPFKTRYQLYLEKTGQIETAQENECMRWGTILEPVIAQEFAERSGLSLLPCDHHFQADEPFSFMTCTPDFFVLDEQCEKGLLEIKTCSAWQADAWAEGVPDYAHCQVMHQMAVTGLQYAYVACLIGGQKLVWHRIERDEDVIEQIRMLEAEFWQMCENLEPPRVEAQDSETLALLYSQATADKNIELHGCEHTASILMQLKEQIKALESAAGKCEAEIKEVMQDAEKAKCGAYIVSWANRSRESLDSKALKQSQPDTYQQFIKKTAYRQFSIKEIKDNGKGQ
jgi:putative phage-type endonuclease